MPTDLITSHVEDIWLEEVVIILVDLLQNFVHVVIDDVHLTTGRLHTVRLPWLLEQYSR